MIDDRPNKVKNSDGNTMKAGGIVVCDQNGEKFVAMIYRPECNDWTFPKGHIELGETIEQASIREIKEEIGVDVQNGIKLPDETYTNENNPGGIIVKMFLFRVRRNQLNCTDDECEPHWIPAEEVEEKLSYDNLKNYFRSIKHLI